MTVESVRLLHLPAASAARGVVALSVDSDDQVAVACEVLLSAGVDVAQRQYVLGGGEGLIAEYTDPREPLDEHDGALTHAYLNDVDGRAYFFAAPPVGRLLAALIAAARIVPGAGLLAERLLWRRVAGPLQAAGLAAVLSHVELDRG